MNNKIFNLSKKFWSSDLKWTCHTFRKINVKVLITQKKIIILDNKETAIIEIENLIHCIIKALFNVRIIQWVIFFWQSYEYKSDLANVCLLETIFISWMSEKFNVGFIMHKIVLCLISMKFMIYLRQVWKENIFLHNIVILFSFVFF